MNPFLDQIQISLFFIFSSPLKGITKNIQKIRARGCRAAYFGPWVRWGRGFGWGAMSVCLCVCVSVCSGWVAACWLFLVLSKERRRGRATHPGDSPLNSRSSTQKAPRDTLVYLRFGSFLRRFFFRYQRIILKSLDFSAQIDFFMNFCPRRATKLRSL